jgi:hypothetical protein
VKSNFRIPIAALLSFLAAGLLVGSQTPDSQTENQSHSLLPSSFSEFQTTNVRWEITQLLRKKAGEFKLVDVTAEEVASDPTPVENRPDLLILERFVVTHRPPEKIELPPPETVAQKFFGTGTFASHVGKKITTRFWMHPRKGLMLSFEF